jgi:hypothetical protein
VPHCPHVPHIPAPPTHPQVALSLLGVANRMLLSAAEQVMVAGPARRTQLASAGVEDWVAVAVQRVGSAMAASLTPGSPPMVVSSLDRSTQRRLTVGCGVWGVWAGWGVGCGVWGVSGRSRRCFVRQCVHESVPLCIRTRARTLQVEVARSAAESVGLALTQDMQLSPYLDTQDLPSVVDTLRTVWPINPYGPMRTDASPQPEAANAPAPMGSVVEISVLDAGNHTRGDLSLPGIVPVAAGGGSAAAGSSMPVHFRIPLGTWSMGSSWGWGVGNDGVFGGACLCVRACVCSVRCVSPTRPRSSVPCFTV